MKTSLIIPSFKRPDTLIRCLNSVFKQTIKPDEIIIVLHQEDKESFKKIKENFSNECKTGYIKIVKVNKIGTDVFYQKGIKEAKWDILFFTDDDAILPPKWIEKTLENYKKYPYVGGCGGRDIVIKTDGSIIHKKTKYVGEFRYLFHFVGRNHLFLYPPRKKFVHCLKGVNMSLKRKYLKDLEFPSNFFEKNMHYGIEFEICFWVRLKKKRKLLYDPLNVVFHKVSPRPKELFKRNDLIILKTSMANKTFIFLRYLTLPQKILFIIFSFLIGNLSQPGFLLIFLSPYLRDKKVPLKILHTIKGLSKGFFNYLRYLFSKS